MFCIHAPHSFSPVRKGGVSVCTCKILRDQQRKLRRRYVPWVLRPGECLRMQLAWLKENFVFADCVGPQGSERRQEELGLAQSKAVDDWRAGQPAPPYFLPLQVSRQPGPAVAALDHVGRGRRRGGAENRRLPRPSVGGDHAGEQTYRTSFNCSSLAAYIQVLHHHPGGFASSFVKRRKTQLIGVDGKIAYATILRWMKSGS